MKIDKKREYSLIIILCLVLLFNLFVLNIFKNKIIFAIVLCIYVIICKMLVKSKKIENINKKTIIFLMIFFAIAYIGILYIIGIFVGFYKNPVSFSLKVLYNRILPYTAIIIFSEMIRGIFITKDNKKITNIVTIVLILIDVSTYINFYNLSILEEVLALIGYICLSSISMNLLCNYIAKRYGIIPTLLYRCITTIYTYIFLILPNIYLFFQSTFRIIYPYIIYLIIESLFTTNNFKEALNKRKSNWIGLIITIIILISIVLLVSCNFKYGVMVVGSSSMAEAINKGDVVVFEQYEGQKLEEGQIIIFNKNKVKTIHRIDDIQVLNEETIYYTKGDNNQQKDEGYRKDKDIIGIVKFKILYVGWPTIWINNIFSN